MLNRDELLIPFYLFLVVRLYSRTMLFEDAHVHETLLGNYPSWRKCVRGKING